MLLYTFIYSYSTNEVYVFLNRKDCTEKVIHKKKHQHLVKMSLTHMCNNNCPKVFFFFRTRNFLIYGCANYRFSLFRTLKKYLSTFYNISKYIPSEHFILISPCEFSKIFPLMLPILQKKRNLVSSKRKKRRKNDKSAMKKRKKHARSSFNAHLINDF